MILAALPNSYPPPHDIKFVGSETHKTHSEDTSHPIEYLQKSTSVKIQ